MGNPLMNMIGGFGTQGNPMNNPMQFMQEFQKFRSQFGNNANPQAILNDMLKSGKINNSHVDQAMQMAKQMGFIK